MNAVGIIAEYNPFHKGHEYHLKEALRLSGADCAVCVMSGDFLQRGEPALFDKWTRAEMAVESGVDLVLELPFAFAVNSARYFAMGGVAVLGGLGCVTHLAFGSESGDAALLSEAAAALSEAPEDPRLSAEVRSALDQGKTYPAARHQAACRIYGERIAELLLSPNNILAIEYLKQCAVLNAPMVPVTVKRQGSGYHEERLPGKKEDGAAGVEAGFASAKAIRARLLAGDRNLGEEETRPAILRDPKSVKSFLPESSFRVLEERTGERLITLDDFYQLVTGRLLCEDRERLAQVASVGEGLENRLKGALSKARDMESLLDGVRSKRYSTARIRRLLVHVLTGLNREDFDCFVNQRPFYARVLGFSKKGAALLAQQKRSEASSGGSRIPILTNINREMPEAEAARKLLRYDILSSDLYQLVKTGDLYRRSDHVMRPVMKK